MPEDAATLHAASHNDPHWRERTDLAAAFRWAVRYDLHEAVANHFSLAVNEDGTQFLLNPKKHFARIRASDLLLIDADDPETMNRPDAPDPTAWGLHGALHRGCKRARCALHLHSHYATVLASLADSRLPAIDQNSALFFDRVVIDEGYGGMAFEEEGARVCGLFNAAPKATIMVMGNHGVMAIGETVGQAFDRMYYFERAARNVITAYMTGKPLRTLPDAVAEKVAQELEDYPSDLVESHLGELKAILDQEGSDYAS
ncbi:MAG: class II aldolase and adducin N-terminal domain-containing protein [Pseudomonadota bacterium]